MGFAVLATAQWGRFSDPLEINTFESALTTFANTSNHPELEHAPWLPLGMSNGGQMSYGLNALRPHKVIAFAANKGGFYNVSLPSFSALATPGLLVASEQDTSQRRNAIQALFDQNRPRGARWGWLEEEATAHTLGDSLEIILPFIAAMTEARYPPSLTTELGPPTLLPSAENDGWLVDRDSFRNGLASIHEHISVTGNALSYGWLPNRRLAFIYRAFASYDKAFATARITPDIPFIRLGDSILYQIISPADEWTQINFYDGDVLIREVKPGDPDSLEVVTSPDVAGYSVLHAIVTNASGIRRTTMPRRMLVLPRIIEEPLPFLSDVGPVDGPNQIEQGDSFSLSVSIENQPGLEYVWTRDGQPVRGATSPDLTVPLALPGHAGSYQLTATLGSLQKSSPPHLLTINNSTEAAGKLINLSFRGNSVDDTHPLVAGFVLTGNETKSLLLRAVGPGLEPFGVSQAMSDPSLNLLQLSVSADAISLGSNAQWNESSEIENISARVGAFPLALTSRDAALSRQLPAGRYTAEVRNVQGSSGIALVEIYDVSTSPATDEVQLVNLSARAVAGSGDAALVGGFVISLGAPVKLLLRAVGPGLTQFNITNPVTNPKLTLFRQDSASSSMPQLIGTNQQWEEHDDLVTLAGQTVGAFALDSGSFDAAMVVRLEPGVYSVVIEDPSEETRILLFEIYQIP